MITAERLMSALASKGEVSGESPETGSGPQKTLISDEEWDCFHLESLLAVKETYRETRDFGFLLRHYWMPATELRNRHSSRLTLPDGTVDRQELVGERRMASCSANECLWRAKVFPAGASAGNGNGSPPVVLDEVLCSYDRYEQTFHAAKPIEFGPLPPELKMEARRWALYHLPIIVPAGPVPLGFRWYAKADDDYMNYHLESEEQVGETSVLVIRRRGRVTIRLPQEGEAEPPAVVIERKGVTLFAWNRSVVLEDRIMDCVAEASGSFGPCVGATEQMVTRLVRSCPTGVPSERTKQSRCCL